MQRNNKCPLCAKSGHDVVYSIVSSARSKAACGMTKPNDFAVVRFSTNSNLVGNSAGKSAGFTPQHLSYHSADLTIGVEKSWPV